MHITGLSHRLWFSAVRIRLFGQYLIVMVGVLGVTLTLFKVQQGLGSINLSIAYLLIVLVCAAFAHSGVTLFCGLFSFICYDFFLVPPVFTLRIDSPAYLIDSLAFVAVALVTCVMAGRARQRAMQTMVYREADQIRATLLHLLSHNLRTPLSTIKTALSSLIALDQLPADSLQLVTEADQECDRLNRLIGNVLHLSRMDAHAIRLKTDWNALDEVISVVFSRWPVAVKNGNLSAELPNALPLLSFDFELIAAVLTNLVENGFKHGYPPVRVLVSNNRDQVQVCVEDCGTGVSVAERSRLFTRFSSASPSGIGLGLAVCKGLIEMHHGRIWAEFPPGHSRFCFSLPAVYYEDTQEQEPKNPEHKMED